MDPKALKWRCRRGMRELDVVLERHLESRYPTASAAEQAAFCRLLELEDPELYTYLTGRSEPQDPEFSAIVRQLTQA